MQTKRTSDEHLANRAPIWKAGWYRDAASCPSPHANERPGGALVDLIVVHSISLPPGRFGGGAIFALFTGTLEDQADPYFRQLRGLEVSSHFFIRRDGAIWQFVDCDRRAWHAGTSRYRGRDACNDDSVGIELEGLEDGDAFEAAQYEALEQLCRDLKTRYPIQYVAGHADIAPGRKVDPGKSFDWTRLQASLAWSPGFFPGHQA
jgi:AmpD protein